jgi:lysophospholipase L1-like esterase
MLGCVASIYMLGDSHTQALGPRLAALLPQHRVIYEAFPGAGTRGATSKMTQPVGVDVVAISLGGNDFGDQSASRAALVQAVRARNPQARLLWLGPFAATAPDVAKRHGLQAAAQREQLPALGVDWLDTRLWSTQLGADGVHFTTSGYDTLSKALRGSVASAIGSGVGVLVAVGVAGALLVALWRRFTHKDLAS